MQSSTCIAALGERNVTCYFRGRLKLEDVSVYPGDFVELEERQGSYQILRVMERKNFLVRPAVANVDQGVVVTAITEPPLDLLYLDRLLVHLELRGIDAVVCINKCDIEDPEAISRVRAIYEKAGYPVAVTSAATGEGLSALVRGMQGKNVVLSGASGVGKSRILSSLLKTNLVVGDLSRQRRGRHTTKGVTLYRAGESGFLADTPGFSKLDVVDCRPEELSYFYREMADLAPLCHFPRCLHKTEDHCEVKRALAEGRIGQERYKTYLALLEECRTKEKRKYE